VIEVFKIRSRLGSRRLADAALFYRDARDDSRPRRHPEEGINIASLSSPQQRARSFMQMTSTRRSQTAPRAICAVQEMARAQYLIDP